MTGSSPKTCNKMVSRHSTSTQIPQSFSKLIATICLSILIVDLTHLTSQTNGQSAISERPSEAPDAPLIVATSPSPVGTLSIESEHLERPPEEASRRRERLTVLAPRRLRPQSDYHVIVSLARSEAPANVDISLTGAKDSTHEHSVSKSVIAQSGETQTVKFEIGDWPAAEYVLNVTALAHDMSWNFTREATLDYQAKKFSIIVQTDKAIYKPGEEVKFRAIFLNPKLNPLNLNQEINVTITDPKRNLVKQWIGESNEHGLYSATMGLSEDPMVGSEWTIKVEARGQVGVKHFQVAEYILPTFDVAIELPPYATYNKSDIVASVRATYTYGKPVDGHVILTVQPKYRYYQIQTKPLDSNQFRAALHPETGKADFQMNLLKELWLEHDHFEREIEFFAVVEERLTGRKYNKTESMFVYEKPIKIELLHRERTSKAGLGHLLQFRVAYQDNKPVEDNGPEMKVRLIAEQQLINLSSVRPVSGQAELWVQIPKTIKAPNHYNPEGNPEMFDYEPRYIDVQVMYRNQVHHVAQIEGQSTKSQHHLSVQLPHLRTLSKSTGARRPPRSISVDDELRVQVEATEPMTQVTCQGMARGDIVWVLTREPRDETQFEFSVKLDQRMTPEMRILCFYVRDENREMIADGLTFPVAGLFRNPLKLSFSTEEARPGQEVEVIALTKADSLVGLLAVDQSVLLLKSGNDISQDDLNEEAKSYGSRFSDTHYYWGSPTNAARLFERADVIVLTNNRVYNGYEFVDENTEANNHYGGVEALSGRSMFQQSAARIELISKKVTQPQSAPDLLNLQKQPQEHVVIRRDFPETWLWQNVTVGPDGKALISARVPDTITSWELSGFSLNDEHGFGLSSGKTSLRVFRPFFVKLNLPYSIIRGEVLNLQCVVFNYGQRPTKARVTLDNQAGEFEFVEPSNEIDQDIESKPKSTETHEVQIESEQAASVSFLVRPKKLGYLDVRVTARSSTASDGVLEKLLVKPEGQIQYMNKAMLLNSNGSQSLDLVKNFTIEVPPNAVPNSRRVYASAVGDVMGAGLANVDDLLRLPYGCGEQNMINLVPNIVILNYLTSSRRLRESQRQLAIKNIETGYQRQLNYMRHDGSFSAFGDSDTNGSIWLTAYVLKTFQQARPYLAVDPKVLQRAANFVGQLAQSDGSIKELGMIHNKDLQSKSQASSSIYLTAYCMIALLQGPLDNAEHHNNDAEIPPHTKALDEVIQKGLGYLQGRHGAEFGHLSTYDFAIINYAFQLGSQRNMIDPVFATLVHHQLWARRRFDQSGTWWSNGEREDVPGPHPAPTNATVQPPLKPIANIGKHSSHHFLPDSMSVEITALALLAIVRRNEPDQYWKEQSWDIVKWLISQQNSNGGYASTQDTVLAIEALSAFAAADAASLGANSGTKLELELLYPRPNATRNSLRKNVVDQMLISSPNELVNQKLRLPDDINWIQVAATGVGSGVVQISWQYNLLVSAEEPAFYLNPIIDAASTMNYLQLSVCTNYKAGERSNMAILDVELPSGYAADSEALHALKRSSQVKRVDSADGDTRVFVYLDKVTHEELCLTVPAHRTAKVANNKPVPVTIYDYYDRHQAARIFYEPQSTTSCDICDSESCSKKCNKTHANLEDSNSNKQTSLHDQRKNSKSTQNPNNKSLASSKTQQASFLIPLAPVVMTLLSFV